MESINPDDISDLDHNQISIITLKNGNIITIDDTIPAKKPKKITTKRNSFSSYQISQRLINLTIIGKKENIINPNLNFNKKNKIFKNINFSYNSTNNNKQTVKDNLLKDKNNDFPNKDNPKEQMKKFYTDNFKYNDIGNKNIKLNNQNLKMDSNKEEIEKIKVVEMDLDSKSNNDYKILINEFDKKRKDQIKLEQKINNINFLLNSNHILYKEPKKFDFADHFNFLVNKFRNKVRDINRDNFNKRYFEIYKDFKNKNRKNEIFIRDSYNLFSRTGNFNNRNKKFLTTSSVIKTKNNDSILRNSNIISLKDKLFKKHSSFEPKIFRTLYLGSQIILPSN